MSDTTAPASTSGTVTFHIGRTMDVPMTFTLAGAKVAPVAGGTLTVADTTIATGSMSDDGGMAKFVGVKVGTTTATYSNTSGGDALSGSLTLDVIEAPAADAAAFDVSDATEEPVAAAATPVAAEPVADPAPVAPAAS